MKVTVVGAGAIGAHAGAALHHADAEVSLIARGRPNGFAVAGRGFDARISTEHEAPLTDSACVHCGVGRNVTLHVQDNEIAKVTSPHDNPVTHGHGNLCIKGRFGFQHVQNRV
ncbi:2-dehydropantoate 2-reductase N-terminal domain-containing protein [Streptomyces sp. JH14]|uniref:2-dehydropantoate 2-reductase N-terminal domain-containing protein n=1 Tax=Streptomyces sp. JH14 TaxID=2793630 RepID=UPI0023F64397|nr:2-dehydropantoate 2-reductase N-terminal domain-containing protein [Streptomyces sp. JH14]